MALTTEIERLERRWQENPLGLTFVPYAEALRKAGDPGKALELLELGLGQHPNYVPAHIVRGRCHLDGDAYDQAELAFLKVTELDPENLIALKSLAEVSERANRIPDAVHRLQMILDIDPNNAEARGHVDRLREALPHATEAPPAADPVSTAPLELEPGPFEALPAVGFDEDLAPAVGPVHSAPAESASDGAGVYRLSNDSDSLHPTRDLLDNVVLGPEIFEVEGLLPPPLDHLEIRDDEPVRDFEPEPLLPEASPTRHDDPEPILDVELPPPGMERDPFEDPGNPTAPGDSWSSLLLTNDGEDAEATAAAEPVAEAASASAHEEPVQFGSPPVPEPGPIAESASVVEVSLEPEREPEPVMDTDASSEPEAAAAPLTEGDPAREPEPYGTPTPEEPELVVTETMAEIFLRQGHRELALAVYAQLSQRDPANERVVQAFTQLSDKLALPSAAREAEMPRPSYDAASTGGRSVEQLFGSMLSTPRPAVSATVHPPAFESRRRPPGEPTRPAEEALSLSAVFGEEGLPAAPAGSPIPSGEPTFDEFFAPAAGPADEVNLPSPPAETEPAQVPEDLEQFNSWLRGLKR